MALATVTPANLKARRTDAATPDHRYARVLPNAHRRSRPAQAAQLLAWLIADGVGRSLERACEEHAEAPCR
ncbi:MAG: hypothetical protein U0531_13870 [Dehalococcoidia bacterium]